MKIAIVDDISDERTLLRNRLESQFSRRNVHADIFEYENGETFLTSTYFFGHIIILHIHETQAPHTGDVVKVGPVQSGMIYVRR